MTEPTTTPITGAHRRSAPVALSAMATITATVASALSAPAPSGLSFGTCLSMSKMMGITVTGISMITVPATVGVRMRRNSESRAESANWNSAETATSVASMAGPPLAIAATQIAMNAPEVPMAST